MTILCSSFNSLYVKKDNGCWEWIGKLSSEGYGKFGNYLAHRLSFLNYNGYLPAWPDKMVLHKCNNKRCINPKHLYEGDHIDNSKDGPERYEHPIVDKFRAMLKF